MAAVLCIAFNGAGSKVIYAVWVQDSEYSVKTNEGNLIMSVEKVGVNALGDASTPLYLNSDLDKTPVNKMIYAGTNNEDAQAYYYTDLYGDLSSENNNTKYVVHDGEYVMLNNDNFSDGLYNQNIPFAFDEAGEQVRMAEAIMVSFGQYYYDEGGILNLAGQPEFNSGARIESLSVTAEHNGAPITLANRQIREYSNNLYNDFAYIIPQVEGNEGHYKFTFSYFYGNFNGPIVLEFNFNLLFKTSYTGIETVTNDANNRFYTAQPTLFNPQNPNMQNGVYNFNLGKDASDYPILVYDYSKYRMSYTHIVNGTTTNYTFNPTPITLDGESATLNLVANISNNNVTYQMNKFVRGGSNFVVFVFTEMGDYTFNFEYLYENQIDARTVELSSEGMNLRVNSISLSIKGFELKYAKNNFREAQLRYIKLANGKNNAEVIAPNDIEKINSLTSLNLQRLTAKFEYDNSSSKFAGSVVETKDANVVSQNIASLNDSEKVGSLAAKVGTEGSDISTDIAEIDFIKVNQPPIYLDANVDRGENSFYLYAKRFENFASADKQDYTNLTRFNDTGYYLVFINANVTSGSYYQLFAFNYVNEVVNADVQEIDHGRELGNDEYTKNPVIVSWEKPTLFESEINGYYYYILDRYLTDSFTRSQLISSPNVTRKPIVNGVTEIGGLNEIGDGHGASIVVELVGEGQTFRTFTIDRTNISGVALYAVNESVTSGGVTYYRVATNVDGSPARIDNSIFSGNVTLFWNNKISGAEINASYVYLPFEKDSSATISQVFANNSDSWFSTSYKLGSASGRLTNFTRVDDLSGYLTGNNILNRQGIYLFTISDIAGNSCNYMFVLDNTEAYFKVISSSGEEFATRTSKIYDNDVKVEVSTHKAIELTLYTDEIYSAITSFAAGNVPDNYYRGENLNGVYNSTNTNALHALFRAANGKYYLTVRNERVYPYDGNFSYDGSIIFNSDNRPANNNYILKGNYVQIAKSNNEISTYREIYLTGINQANISALSSNSFIKIEVNTDNSRLMAYYSNNQFASSSNTGNIPTDGLDSNNIIRLRTGTSFDGAANSDPLKNTWATSENYVGIVWNRVGESGDFEVATVSYTFYSRGSEFSNDNYFYTPTAENVMLYSNNTYSNGAFAFGNNKAFAFLRLINGATQEGLYKITRTYTGATAASGDHQTVNYYLIVDRTGIKTTDVGANISVGLKDNENRFNSFTRVNTESSSITNVVDRDASGNIINNENGQASFIGGNSGVNYNVYFTSNKLPAVLNIPYSKYYDGANATKYHAGALNFKVVFKDSNSTSQFGGIEGVNVGQGYLIMSGTAVGDEESAYYTINFRNYINNFNSAFASRFVYSSNETDWMCLPGDYVVIVSDNVRSLNHLTGGTHELVFGFRITPNAPSTDVYTVPSQFDESKGYIPIYEFTVANGEQPIKNDDGSYTLVTNKEFVAIELPKYDESALQAGVDINYIVVTKNGRNYIDYRYGQGSLADSDFIINERENGNVVSRKIYLQTDLRDASGNINYSALSQSLTYQITIRFNISGYGYNELYKNAYYVSDERGNISTYFEINYIINIDRLAPSINVHSLMENDSLINYYTSEPMFKDDYYSNLNNVNINGKGYSYYNLYFVNQYGKYVKNEEGSSGTINEANIYALRVNGNTPFNCTQTKQIYYKNYNGGNLQMPVNDFEDYTPQYVSTNLTYGFLNLAGYYEILEVDEAKNISQYVVFYSNESADNLTVGLVVGQNDGDDEQINFNLSTGIAGHLGNQLTIFSVEPGAISLAEGEDKFYHFEIINRATGSKTEINTNFATNFTTSDGLASQIANMIINAKEGNYTFVLQSRAHRWVYSLDYYDRASFEDASTYIQAESLVGQNKRSISFARGLTQKLITTDSQAQIVIYATTIIITHNGDTQRYVCQPDNNYRYVLEGTSQVYSGINDLSGTYSLQVVDSLGRSTYYEFNTDQDLYFINFGENGNANYYTAADKIYFTFNQANIQFNSSIYRANLTYRIGNTQNTIQCNEFSGEVEYYDSVIIKISQSGDFVTINLLPYFGNAGGEILTATVQFTKMVGDQSFVDSYTVTVDSTSSGVTLRNIMGNTTPLNVVDVNKNVLLTTSSANTSGTSYLSWNKTENNYFDYNYLLVKPDGQTENLLRLMDANGLGNKEINPHLDGVGVYRFVVEIFAKGVNDLTNITAEERQKLYLGNKIYTFTVNEESNTTFTVRAGDYVVLTNSTFSFNDIINDSTLSVSQGMLKNAFNLDDNFNYDLNSWKLYVHNQKMNVVPETKLHATAIAYPTNTPILIGNYELVIYKISSPTTSTEYIATLYVPETNTILNNDSFMVNSNRLANVTEQTYFRPFVGTPQTTFELKINQVLPESSFARKNLVVAQVEYNGYNLETVMGKDGAFSYTILGNGDYSFVFTDLAGNTHQFNSYENNLHLTILREVALTINGHAPVSNAIYSYDAYDENAVPVVINLVGGGNYYTRNSIEISVLRNWQPYRGYLAQNYSYTFTNYGTYSVTISATDLSNQLQTKLTKTVEFTIINPNEAVELINLSGLGKYEFTKVSKIVNNAKEDITAGFTSIINPRNGMMLTYEMLLANRNEFKTTSGKQTFEITYLVNNDCYEPREQSFTVTLNNEQPNIYCSLEYGQSSNRGFSISYTPSIIYEQVGDCTLYVNNILVATINKDSINNSLVVERYFSQSEFGSGDYLIVLYSSSGVPLTHYKVTLTEPLNIWAIIIIIVVVAVVTTVVVLIFVLRHKMRIR